jgi:Flp pilus assembly protein TadG
VTALSPGTRGRRRGTDDAGSAIVELVLAVAVLLVPMAYAVLAVFDVQRASYAVTGAAREAGRAFVTADTAAQARAAAGVAAEVALLDQGLDRDSVTLDLACSTRACLAPGSSVTATLSARVPLPFAGPLASVRVEGRHVAVVDRYRGSQG